MIGPCETCTRGGELKILAGEITLRVATQNVISDIIVDSIDDYIKNEDYEYGPVPIEFKDKAAEQSSISNEVSKDLIIGIDEAESVVCDSHEPNICPRFEVLKKLEELIISKTAQVSIHLGPHELDF